MTIKRLSQDEFTMLRSLLRNDTYCELDVLEWRKCGGSAWEWENSATKRWLAIELCEELLKKGMVVSSPLTCCRQHEGVQRFSLSPSGRAFIEKANGQTKGLPEEELSRDAARYQSSFAGALRKVFAWFSVP